MFTGVIEERGIIKEVKRADTGAILSIESRIPSSDSKIGDSMAVDGVCLTVSGINKNILSFDVIEETIRRSMLGSLKRGSYVNLERSLKADSRIGGHFVSGHVDYRGTIERISRDKDGTAFVVSLPGEFSAFVAEKGSIALDGVSLTVARVTKKNFTAYLIPHTLKLTTLRDKKRGDMLNVETDLLAKYLKKQTPQPNLETLLKKYQYI